MNKEERQRRKSSYLALDINEADSYLNTTNKSLKKVEEFAKYCIKADLEEYDEKTCYYIYEIKFVKKIK